VTIARSWRYPGLLTAGAGQGVGEELGLEVTARGKLEPLRAKLTKLADRGWLHKRPDGRFTTRP
jgi:hypothetical protein